MSYVIHTGSNLDVLPTLPDNSIDAIVTDPPYGLEFMGKEWDAPWKQTNYASIKEGNGSPHARKHSVNFVGSPNPTCKNCGGLRSLASEGSGGRIKCKCDNPNFPNTRTPAMQAFQDWYYSVAVEIYRVLKPGGHILSFGGSRTYHRMACAIEDAGFEIRDQMMWVYGSGFPKSHNISKAMDKANGVEREDKFEGAFDRFAGPTGNKKCDKCGKWLVSGSPCQCPRPQDEAKSPEAKQWEGWGTALKPAHEPIVLARKPLEGTVVDNVRKWGVGGLNIDGCRIGEGTGRFPANLMHDGSQEVMELFPESKSTGGAGGGKLGARTYGSFANKTLAANAGGLGDEGSAARFFYCPKASKSDRDEGCEGEPIKTLHRVDIGSSLENDPSWKPIERKNNHPTVKPTELMRYLCRLITPQGGTVLDPFNGSGSTGKAAVLEGFNYIGIEMNSEYVAISEARIKAALER